MLGIKNYMEQCNYSFCREYATKAKVSEYIGNLEKQKKKQKKKKSCLEDDISISLVNKIKTSFITSFIITSIIRS